MFTIRVAINERETYTLPGGKTLNTSISKAQEEIAKFDEQVTYEITIWNSATPEFYVWRDRYSPE